MASNPHFFFRLAEAVTLRRSFLMLASSFRVGTFFNSSFRPFSISFARHLKLENDILALGSCVVPLAVSNNPASLFSKYITTARAISRHSSCFIGTVKQNLGSALPAADTQNSHFACIENRF